MNNPEAEANRYDDTVSQKETSFVVPLLQNTHSKTAERRVNEGIYSPPLHEHVSQSYIYIHQIGSAKNSLAFE